MHRRSMFLLTAVSAFLVLFLSCRVAAQVELRDTIRITPGGKFPPLTASDSAALKPKGSVIPHHSEPSVLGIPAEQPFSRDSAYEAFRSAKGFLTPALNSAGYLDCNEPLDTIAVLNPSPIYQTVVHNGEVFFSNSGTFEFSFSGGSISTVMLLGGELQTCCAIEHGIGADDGLKIYINGSIVINYDLNWYQGQYIDRDGLDITEFLQEGTNTFEVTAFDIYGYFEGVPPLCLVSTPAACPTVVVTPSTIGPGDTATVAMMLKYPDGCTIPYTPEYQMFDFSIVQGAEYGKLISWDSEGSSVGCAFSPVLFVADSGIPEAGASVQITGVPDYWCGGGAAKIVSGNKGIPGRGSKTTAATRPRINSYECEQPQALVHLQACPFRRRSDALTAIPQRSIVILPENDHIVPYTAEADAVTRIKDISYFVSDQRDHSSNQGLLAVVDYSAEIEWGLYLDGYTPSEGYVYVDNNLSGINANNKEAALKILNSTWHELSGGVAVYWLLDASRAHERVHHDQLKKKLIMEFNVALKAINKLRLPPNYCANTAGQVAGWLDKYQDYAKNQLDNAMERVNAYQWDKYLIEPPAYLAGYREAHKIIQRIKDTIQ